MTCKQCRWLDVEPDTAGRRVVRAANAYRCICPDPAKPILPASVYASYRGFMWPPDRSFMTGSMGEDCPCFEDWNT